MAERVIDTLVTRWLHKTDTRALEGLERRVESLRRGLNTASRGFTIAGGALTAALGITGRTIVNFETEMNNLKAVLNATDEEMAALRDQASELGKTTSFSASQAAAAQTLLGQAGLDTTQILAALPHVLSQAVAGQLSLEESAAITTATLASYNFEAEDAGRVADVLSKAAASAKTTVSQMGVALRNSAATAKGIGVPFEELAAILAVLQNNGLRAETSGVAVRNMISRLLKPTKEVSEALDRMGVSQGQVADLLNQGRLSDVFKLIAEKGLTAADAVSLFGVETLGAALIITKSGKEIGDLTVALENARGEAKRMANTQMEGLPGAIKEVRSAFEAAQLAIGEAGLTGGLERIADRVRDVLIWFADLDRGTRQFISAALLLGPAFLGIGVALRGLSFALIGLVPALRAVGFMVGLLVSPFGLVAAAASGAAYLIWRNWEPVGAFFGDVWSKIKGAFPDAAAFFENLWQDISAPVDGIFDWVNDAWSATLDWISGPGEGESPLDWLERPIHGLFDWIPVAWNRTLAVISEPVTEVWDWLLDGIPGAFSWVRTQWNSALEWIAVPAIGVWAWVRSGAPGIFNWVSEQWEAALDVPAWGVTLFAALHDAIIGTNFVEIGSTVGETIGNGIVAAASGLTNLLAMMTATVSGLDFNLVGTSIGAFIGEAVVNRIAGLANLLSSLATTVSSLDFTGIGAAIGSAIGASVVTSLSYLTGLLSGLAATILGFDFEPIGTSIGMAIEVAAVGAIIGLTGLLSGLATSISGIDFASVGRLIGTLIRAAFVASIDLGGAIFRGLANTPLEEWKRIGTDIATAIFDAMAAVFGGLGDFVGGIFEGLFGIDTGRGGIEQRIADADIESREPGFFDRLFNFGGSDPTPALAATGAINSPSVNQSRDTSLNIERLEVNVPNGDPETIARGIEGAWREELHNTAEDFSTGQAR